MDNLRAKRVRDLLKQMQPPTVITIGLSSGKGDDLFGPPPESEMPDEQRKKKRKSEDEENQEGDDQ